MTQPIQLLDQVYAVEVPDKAEAFKVECIPEADFYELSCYRIAEYNEPISVADIGLPAGDWEIICTSKEATEEQAKGIVQQDWDGYKDYGEVDLSLVPWIHAKDSLRSLLGSKGLDKTKNYIILKKTA